MSVCAQNVSVTSCTNKLYCTNNSHSSSSRHRRNSAENLNSVLNSELRLQKFRNPNLVLKKHSSTYLQFGGILGGRLKISYLGRQHGVVFVGPARVVMMQWW